MRHQPRKRFGQHFLTDTAVLDAIVGAIDAKPGQALIEIGPGLGALTKPLLERCQRLTVIELDRDLAARLRKNPALDVIEADVLTVNFAALGTRLRIVGNLPYNISTPILFHLQDAADRIGLPKQPNASQESGSFSASTDDASEPVGSAGPSASVASLP